MDHAANPADCAQQWIAFRFRCRALIEECAELSLLLGFGQIGGDGEYLRIHLPVEDFVKFPEPLFVFLRAGLNVGGSNGFAKIEGNPLAGATEVFVVQAGRDHLHTLQRVVAVPDFIGHPRSTFAKGAQAPFIYANTFREDHHGIALFERIVAFLRGNIMVFDILPAFRTAKNGDQVDLAQPERSRFFSENVAASERMNGLFEHGADYHRIEK